MQKNFEVLKRKFPEIYDKIVNAESSKYQVDFSQNVLKINNLTCFSKYNPEKEALKLIENFNPSKKNILVFGTSNPFVIKKLADKFNVFIYIPDAGLFKKILQYIDFTEIFERIENIYIDKKVPLDFEIFPLKVEKKLFHNLLNQLTSVKKESFIKVLLVNPIYGGSLPIAKYVEKNLKNFNVKLKVINSEVFNKGYEFIKSNFINKANYSKTMKSFLSLFSEIILASIDEFRPDVILGVAQSPIDFKVLNYCEKRGILRAFWFVEDYKLFTYWKEFAPKYDFYFTIQKDEFFNELKKINAKNFYYLPLSAEPKVHKPLKLTEEEKKRYGSTISFVGAGYYNRRIFFRNLLEYDFKIWGSDWEDELILKDKIQENGRRVTPEEYVKIFNASLINLNLHSSTYLPGVDPEGDFVNPRTFEICATNSIQIVDRRKYLQELFVENEEILCYSNISELKRLINSILKDKEKYKVIAENGYRRVLKEHTYYHRVKKMFQLMGFELKEPDFIEGSCEFYLFKFNTLDEIADFIKRKKRVNNDEMIFLLMKALKDTYLR